MKTLFLLAIMLLSFTFAAAQSHEYAPVVEKEINYKDWTYKSVRDGKETNLRDFTKGKKLVMVVYFAPWCPNWKLEAPVAQKLYEKYKADGLDVIGVGEYDTIDVMKASLDTFKITFPAVYELELKETKERSDVKQKTLHYEYRQKTGVAAPEEDRPLYVEGLNTPRRSEIIADALMKRGYPERVTEKVLGANFIQAFGRIW